MYPFSVLFCSVTKVSHYKYFDCYLSANNTCVIMQYWFCGISLDFFAGLQSRVTP